MTADNLEKSIRTNRSGKHVAAHRAKHERAVAPTVPIALAKHTPGPWRQVEKYPEFIIGPDGRNGPICIATVESERAYDRHGWSAPGKSAEANATLIAAAPRMLAALRSVYGYLSGIGHEGAIEVRLAIDEAEGRK